MANEAGLFRKPRALAQGVFIIMLIIPAIDLKEGCVVRLFQGDFTESTVYSKDPVKTAKHWIRQGAQMLHVVDLDGASLGEPKNLDVLKEIIKNVTIPVQFGGGVRSLESISLILEIGCGRVILGTKAALDRDFLERAFKKFANKIIVSIDAKDTLVAIKGWQEDCGKKDLFEFASDLKQIGFKELVYTDISKDGTLKGPNIKNIKALLKQTGMRVIASGGVSSLDDIRKLKSLEKSGVTAVIVGKALYEGRFTLAEAIALN